MSARRIKSAAPWLLAMMCWSVATVRAQSANDEFAPSINGTVLTALADRRGKILLGGSFTQIDGQSATRLTRLFGHGGADPTFSPAIPSGTVRTVVAANNDRVLVGGSFTTINGLNRQRLALLGDNGAPVVGFAPQADNDVHAIALVDDVNAYFIAGEFSQVNGLNRARIARLVGANVDPGFVATNLTGIVRAVAPQRDGKVMLTGTVTRTGAPSTHGPILRLNSDGSNDDEFLFLSAGTDDVGYAIHALPDRRVLVGGSFTSSGGVTRYLMRLNPDGTSDPGFTPPALNGPVRGIAVQADGRIVIVGDFTGLSLRNRIARLNHDGTLDTSYAPLLNPNGNVHAVSVQRHGGAVFAGGFTEVSGLPRLRAARITPHGRLDVRFAAQISSGAVEVLAGQPDGKVLVGGAFSQVNGQTRPYLVRLGVDGITDAAFNATPNNEVRAIAVLPDRSILIGGAFNAVNGVPRLRIAKLGADGTPDPSFNVAVNDGTISAMALQADGKILIGGSFTSIGATLRPGLARLHVDGSLDSSFTPTLLTTFSRIRAIAVRADDVFMTPPGQIYVGGEAAGTNRLERLFADGSLDTAFSRIHNTTIWSIATSGLGPVNYGGDMSVNTCSYFLTTVNGAAPSCLGYPDGRVISFLHTVTGDFLIGGAFSSVQGNLSPGIAQIIRTAAPAEVSPSFNAPVSGDAAMVNSLWLGDDGKLIFAGAFTAVAGITRERIARTSENPAGWPNDLPPTRTSGVETVWNYSGQSVHYVPGGLTPELERAPVLLFSPTCCDAADFLPVIGARASRDDDLAGTWIKEDFTAPTTPFYLRWRYQVRDGRGGTSLHESPITRIAPRSPLLSYVPAPSAAATTLTFPVGPAGTSTRQITVNPSDDEGGISTLTTCTINGSNGPGSFQNLRASPTNFAWGRTSGFVALDCTRAAQITTATLSCVETHSDGSPSLNRSWGLTCPAATTQVDPIFSNGFE